MYTGSLLFRLSDLFAQKTFLNTMPDSWRIGKSPSLVQSLCLLLLLLLLLVTKVPQTAEGVLANLPLSIFILSLC